MAKAKKHHISSYTGLSRGQVCDISFECDTPGPETEYGDITAYWTGEIDYVGKYTLQPVDGGKPYYLFPREIVSVEPI
jgi:hypothetical protein